MLDKTVDYNDLYHNGPVVCIISATNICIYVLSVDFKNALEWVGGSLNSLRFWR